VIFDFQICTSILTVYTCSSSSISSAFRANSQAGPHNDCQEHESSSTYAHCDRMPVAKSEVSEALTVSGCSKILVETPEVAGRPTVWHF